MDDLHLLMAVSYFSVNPVRAGLVGYAANWAWSSVRAHLAGKDDGLVVVRPVLDRVSCLFDLLLEDRDATFAALRRAEVPGVLLVLRSLSPGLNAFLDDQLHGVPQDPRPQPTLATSS